MISGENPAAHCLLLDILSRTRYNRDMNTQSQAVEAIRALSAELPLNDFGLPIGIYRADLLPFHDYAPPNATALAIPDLRPSEMGDGPSDTDIALRPANPLSEGPDPSLPGVPEGPEVDVSEYRIAGFPAKALNQAFVPLQYDEGFPAFQDGRPFWSCLMWEPKDVFRAFESYLQMPLGRPSNPDEDEDNGEAASGTRGLSALIGTLFPHLSNTELLIKIEEYRENFYLYYWGMRTHAYDLFRVAQHQKQQELRALETQDEHYLDARKLRNRLMQYMNSEEEFWDLMTPKVAIDAFKSVTGLERISANLPAGGPPIAKEEGSGQSFEVAFRTIAQTNRPQVRAITEENVEVLSKALEDPETTETLQELIIRVGG